MLDKMLVLALGSVAGGAARWMLTDRIARIGPNSLPLGTLAVNLAGCLLIGLLHGLGDSLSPRGKMLLMIGFCGAFTTFSSLMLEFSLLSERGDWRAAWGYLLASAILGFALLRAGAFVSRAVFR